MSSDEEYDEYGNEEAPREEASSVSRDRATTRNKNLSTLEADIAAKQRGGAGRSRNTGQVGAFSSAGGASKIDAKLRKAGGGSPSGGGTTIVGASAQRSRAPTKFDSVSAAPTTMVTATSSGTVEGGVRSDLTTMEADVAAKVNAARGRAAQGQTIVGASYSAGPLPSKVDAVMFQPNMMVKNSGMTDSMEAVKNRERNRELNNLAADVRAKIQAANTTPSRPADPNPAMDGEITRQERQVSSGYDDDDDVQIRNVEEDMYVKSQSDKDFYDDPYSTSEREKANMGLLPPPPSSGKSFDLPDKFDDEGGIRRPDDYGEHQTYDATGQGYGDAGATEPLMSQFDQYGETMAMDGEGVQAFLAEKKVFDATNVVAAKSEEEEKLDEKKKFRRYLMYGVIALVLLLIAIVVPIAVVFGKVDPTEAPSAAPTETVSLSPSSNRFQETVEYLSSQSKMYEDFSDFNETSAQYMAADWISNDDELVPKVGSTDFLQRYILAVFYFSTGGDGWDDCYRTDPSCTTGFSWLRGNKKECQWDGVRCDGGDQVTRILVGEAVPLGNNLIGTLPSELGYLSLLSSLTIVGGIFEGGQLTGTIPSELGLLTNLNSIYIQAHKITGTVPNELFENKPDLEMIAITRQRLTGPLPTNFAASTKLNDLQFQGNEFTGTIPSEYGRFTTLDNLELKNNNLNGTIPESFYNLDFLTQLSLDGNNLSGTISSRVSGLTDLRFLNLGDNQLKGTIPTTLYEMMNLTVVRVQNNQLTGTISEDIALLNNSFRILEGYNNKFSGEIPIAAFESIPRLREVILHGNNFMTGKVSVALCEKSSLKNLTVPSGVDCVDAGCCN